MYTPEGSMLLFAWGFYVIVIICAALGLMQFSFFVGSISEIKFIGNWFVRAIGAAIAVPLLGLSLFGVGWVMSKVGWFIASPIWFMFE
ncbi:MAG: hypothetical protein AAB355_01180 [Patescibacteria group bacterium]